MKARHLFTAAASSLLFFHIAEAPASAATLLDLSPVISPPNTPFALPFTAGSSNTSFTFAGYNVPAQVILDNVGLYLNGSGPNLFSTMFMAAPTNSQYAHDINYSLYLGSTNPALYDMFTQAVGTTAGSAYTINFNLTGNGNFKSLVTGSENGLRITASDAVAAVPEPATWAMMLLGFGFMGGAMRYRRRRNEFSYATA